MLNKGSLVVLFQHVNTVLCGGKMDLQGQSFCIPEKKGVLGRSSGNPNKELQSLPEMNAYVAVRHPHPLSSTYAHYLPRKCKVFSSICVAEKRVGLVSDAAL